MMNSHKRKAEHQLSPSSVDEFESATCDAFSTPIMGLVQSVLSGLGQGLRKSFTWYQPTPSGERSINLGSPSPGAGPSSNSKINSSAAVKRQKVQRHHPNRPHSNVRAPREMGLPILDLDEARDELEAAQMINKLFEPQPFGFSRRRSAGCEEESQRAYGQRQQEQQQVHERQSRFRRYSGSHHPRSPAAQASPQSSFGQNDRRRRKTASSSVPPSTASVHRNTAETPALLSEDDELSRRMKELLGEDNKAVDSKDGMNMFSPSERMLQKRMKRAEERKARELEAAVLAAKQRRLMRRWPQKALVAPLEPEWERKVEQVLSRRGEVIATTMKGIEIYQDSFERLIRAQQWLNDETINTYLEWVVKAGNQAAADDMRITGEAPSMIPKFIAHNSFFYTILLKEGPARSERIMKRLKVPGISLLEVDTVFVPVNNGSHWTLGVVRPIARTIEYFDSMGGSPTKFVGVMKEWLQTALGKAYKESEWSVPSTKSARQTNGYDCGVFVCTNAFCVAFGLDTSCYEEKDMTQQRKNIAAVLMNRGFEGPFAWAKAGL
ncbi:Cysteine proteinase [Glarea lozoyensis ATCC 20868]|uniref:Cysteine proteinase n=1 Tax=Glarea lozoyensis (strain ATCC 20868 / MF5171) TaxID=1116229 RepID=S3CH47_GLAL2|nr:Cysteine proteinase [Glarea lozoyensis ATCC 20868]EPE25772.1 Cysteine proteinase [Glarea lozoyensis ATCC 20868]